MSIFSRQIKGYRRTLKSLAYKKLVSQYEEPMFESQKNYATLSLKVMINKEKNKVLFAEADSDFTDILLSFLSLPLGRIIRALEKHYREKGEKSPIIGSLSSLYRSLAKLDTSHFVTEGAKQALLSPPSSFEDEYKRLKLDITDSPLAEYFSCSNRFHINRVCSVSIYYDKGICLHCNPTKMIRKQVPKRDYEAGLAACSLGGCDEVLTIHKASFIISDDLQIFPSDVGLLQIISLLGIEDAHKAEQIKVELGFDEIMKLLKASLTSPTPLSDVILNRTTQMDNTWTPLHEIENPKSENLGFDEIMDLLKASLHEIAANQTHNYMSFNLKVMVHKSTSKVLYAQAKEDFVEFLFGFFNIPLGGVEHLLAGKSCVRAIDNLYRGISDLADEYFKTQDMKNRLIKPKLVHGCISINTIFPLAEHPLPAAYKNGIFSSVKFPKGHGKYVDWPTSYMVTDDLTITPFCAVSAFASLNSLNIPTHDVQEMEVQIGLKEALSILNASLVSTSALTDALLSRSLYKPPLNELSDRPFLGSIL